MKKSYPSPAIPPDLFYVYMIETSNGAFYTGYTDDMKTRWEKHCSGRGAKFTRAFPPVRLAACWKISGTKGEAMRTEACVKALTRAEKAELCEKPRKLKKVVRDKKGLDIPMRVCRLTIIDK